MNDRRPASRVFSAIGFMVIGAVATMLLPGTGPAPSTARVRAAGTVDIGFSQDMIVHHHQAVIMAQTARNRVSPPVAQLATSIELNQIKEIGQMQGWLALWNAPQVPSGPPMTWMTTGHPERPGHQDHAGRRTTDTPGSARTTAATGAPGTTDATGATGAPGASGAAGGGMPGMASQQEIERLGRARGKAADTLFLRLMIRHHQGGLLMTAAAAREATIPQVRGLARLIAAEQGRETALMTGLLSTLAPPPRRS